MKENAFNEVLNLHGDLLEQAELCGGQIAKESWVGEQFTAAGHSTKVMPRTGLGL